MAAIALGCCSVIAGWLAHGMVESLFEHVQLAPLLGISLGFVHAAARERSVPAPEVRLESEPHLVPIGLR
jgi:hypothetical protein